MASPEEVMNIMAVLSASYPNFKLPPESLKIYIRMLQHYQADALEAATLSAVKNCKFFPTIAEISSEADKLLRPALPAGGEAWGEAVDMMRFRGHTWEPKFDNPITQKCVDALGWYWLCMSTNQVADRARFIELYDELARRHSTDQNIHPLVRQLSERFSPPLLKNPRYEQLPREISPVDPDEIDAAWDRGEGEMQ
jgi:hypothetical protein